MLVLGMTNLVFSFAVGVVSRFLPREVIIGIGAVRQVHVHVATQRVTSRDVSY